MIMRLRQTVVWFSDLSIPYATTNLPGNAVRLNEIESGKLTDQLKAVRDKIQIDQGQTFNSLLIEKYDHKENKNNSGPFSSCVFTKHKESWLSTHSR
jgi:hypothetical protein